MATAEALAAPASGQPRNFWQWVMVYPALGIALVTATPTWIEKIAAARAGVADYALAEEQSRHWETRADCVARPFDLSRATRTGRIDAKICEPGDVMLTLRTTSAGQKYTWARLEAPEPGGGGLIGTAHAQPAAAQQSAAPQAAVQVQKTSAREVRVVRETPQGCVAERIDSFTGEVRSREPMPCPPKPAR